MRKKILNTKQHETFRFGNRTKFLRQFIEFITKNENFSCPILRQRHYREVFDSAERQAEKTRELINEVKKERDELKRYDSYRMNLSNDISVS